MRTWPLAHVPAAKVIRDLGLQPLPVEGGYWRPEARSESLSSIVYLLTAAPDGFSSLHRLSITEGWQWLAGAPAEVTIIAADGVSVHELRAGQNVVVPAGAWQGARTLGEWTLAACWCAPAYEDGACEFASRAELIRLFPHAEPIVRDLTRDDFPPSG